MARNKSEDNSFRDLVARLNAMSNITPDQERAELMEAANKEPKILDDKDISLADIAKLAGIKEYVEPIKVSKKAQKIYSKNINEYSIRKDVEPSVIVVKFGKFNANDSKLEEIGKKIKIAIYLASKYNWR